MGVSLIKIWQTSLLSSIKHQNIFSIFLNAQYSQIFSSSILLITLNKLSTNPFQINQTFILKNCLKALLESSSSSYFSFFSACSISSLSSTVKEKKRLVAEMLISKFGCSSVFSKGIRILLSIIAVMILSGAYSVYSSLDYRDVRVQFISYSLGQNLSVSVGNFIRSDRFYSILQFNLSGAELISSKKLYYQLAFSFIFTIGYKRQLIRFQFKTLQQNQIQNCKSKQKNLQEDQIGDYQQRTKQILPGPIIQIIMFDIGLDKISNIIKVRSESAIDGLMIKLKPNHHIQKKDSQPSLPSSRIPSKTNTHDQKKSLEDRKNKLMRQLQSVDDQLKRTKLEQSRLEAKKKNQKDYDDPQAYNRAVELVARMNQKRKEHSLAERKKSQQMQLRIQSSLKQFKQMTEKQQKQKQQRRKLIEQRIQKRKEKFQIAKQFSKKSSYLIQELQSYRISLPNISHFKNPQSIQDGFEKVDIKQTVRLSPKALPKSPFLERIQKQELNKKREQYIKSYEKKKIRQRQQVYGRKIRKNLRESSLFVTE